MVFMVLGSVSDGKDSLVLVPTHVERFQSAPRTQIFELSCHHVPCLRCFRPLDRVKDCAIVTKGSYKGAASGFFAGVLLLVAA
jgi:hypothetical protein